MTNQEEPTGIGPYLTLRGVAEATGKAYSTVNRYWTTRLGNYGGAQQSHLLPPPDAFSVEDVSRGMLHIQIGGSEPWPNPDVKVRPLWLPSNFETNRPH